MLFRSTAPASLNAGAAAAGLAVVLAMAACVVVLIKKTERKLKAEYALKEAKNR